MKAPIYPCLWFNDNAKAAAQFYVSIFPNSKLLLETPMVTTFQIGDTPFMALNGGPKHQVNGAVSYFVYCGSTSEIDRIYNALTQGGQIVMPLGTYDWSPKYAWVIDSFGLHWQLDVEDIRTVQKIVPTLLFVNAKNHLVKAAIDHYTTIFQPSRILVEAPYPQGAAVPDNSLLFAQFKIKDMVCNAMSSTMEHDFDFSPGNAMVVQCETQQEIDYYWQHLTDGGQEDMCGWLVDKFGVSWQVVPALLPQLMADREKADRVVQAFLKMRKFDITTLLEA